MTDSVVGGQPLVSVVTATYQRPELLTERCIPSVRAQTYQPLEHLIVIDGPDPALAWTLEHLGYRTDPGERGRVVELGRNWGMVGNAARAAGAWLATGDWLAYLDDDNTYLPGHIEAMVAEAARTGADLVCTAWRMPDGAVWGWTPPGTNRTDASSFLHRRELLTLSCWQPGDGYASDGALIDRWVARGVRWSFLKEPTMIYGGARGGAPE